MAAVRKPVVGTTTLDRPSTGDAIAQALTRQILDGTIPAGTRLREVELADAFDVSRQSLRAGLARLVHEGLLRSAPHRGCGSRNSPPRSCTTCTACVPCSSARRPAS